MWSVRWVLVASVLLPSSSPARRQMPSDVFRCRHDKCRNIDGNTYEVEGKKLKLDFDTLPKIPNVRIVCYGSRVLESNAVPRAEPVLHLQYVRFEDCPLPAAGSLHQIIAALNVKFCEDESEPCKLWLLDPPNAPTFAAKHFVGLERIQDLRIYNRKTRANTERDFLMPLTRLRILLLQGVKIPIDLDPLPNSLEELTLENSALKRLPEAIYASPTLQILEIFQQDPFDGVEVPAKLSMLKHYSPASTLRLEVAPALEILLLKHWVEPMPVSIKHCPVLKQVVLHAPTMRALPDKWLFNCTLMKELRISEAQGLTTLPPTMFSPGSALTQLSISPGVFDTIPEGLLRQLTALETLDMSKNRLKTLPRNLFSTSNYRILEIDFSSNDLDSSVFSVLGQLKSPQPWFKLRLSKLNLEQNPRIGDACGASGYSPLRHMKGLRRLILGATAVSRICRDWREDMPDLEELNLMNTRVSRLSYQDLQYRRAVKAQVLLQGAPVTAITMTKQEYLWAIGAAPSLTILFINAKLQCDCRLYWTRQAMEPSLHALYIYQLECMDSQRVQDVSPENLVCSAKKECTAAGLPAECECTARPDDDLAQDRWLVRVRCANRSRGFVPRRMYPLYPLYQSSNEGLYLTENTIPIN